MIAISKHSKLKMKYFEMRNAPFLYRYHQLLLKSGDFKNFMKGITNVQF